MISDPDNETGPAKKVALLLHGNSGSSRDMAHFAHILENQNYVVLNGDLPLHGQNRTFGQALTIDNCAKYFLDLLSRYKMNPITLVGYSDGANIVLQMLQMKTPNVSQAILISPNSSGTEIKLAWRIVFFLSRALLLSVLYIPQLRRIYRRIGMMTRYDIDLKEIEVPEKTTLVYAERDLILARDQNYLSKMLRRTSIVIPGVNHFTILRSENLLKIFHEEIARH